MRVQVVILIEIDPAAYVAAGIEADHYVPGELDPADHDAVAYAATGYFDAEDHLPRWARNSMRVITQATEIVE
jgi:hypothetical protein